MVLALQARPFLEPLVKNQKLVFRLNAPLLQLPLLEDMHNFYMVEYKDAEFYSEYFSKCEGFNLLEEFKPSDDQDEKKLYVGMVEVLNTIHPLVLRVEIPFTFPHNKLVFRTQSLSGYPHLIHTGKIKYGDWFCLNTPFAETPEEQLNQEIARLKEWIYRQMREDLPSIIKDDNVKHALAFANAYEWENLDEVKEFSSQAMLTFVGKFHNDSNYFKKSLGHLYCIKTPDDRFYAVSDSSLSNHKLPYVIVDQAPKSVDILFDFMQLKELYDWDEETCKHLLPNFNLTGKWCKASSQSLGGGKDWEEEEALRQIEVLEQELNKDESYLPVGTFAEITGQNKKLTKILSSQKSILLEEIKSIKEVVLKEHKYNRWESLSIFGVDKDEMTDEERAEQDAIIDDWIEYGQFEWHHFAFGIKCDDGIAWYILFTNHSLGSHEIVSIDLSLKTIDLQRLVSYPLNRLGVQIITEDMFFGRGTFSENIKSKKIALVGLGAIGSMVANSLAHVGISKIGLWDFDIVEPGNICRSAYSIKDIGESKVNAIASIIRSINPFIETNSIQKHGYWWRLHANHKEFIGASFYANVNYNSQEEAVKELEGYDLIIDCTGSNEMLHFLSYAAPQKEIISICITNHANELLCISNRDGNPFELRKAYLSRIEQDTKNFYIEGNGCYSPTFLATNCDIAALVNLALRELNKSIEAGNLMHSSIYSYTDRGIVSDRLSTYRLDGYDIVLNISSETLYDAEEMEDSPEGDIGYILGSYSRDGKQIMITHVIDSLNAKNILSDAFKTSKGLIDYIGDYRYSGEKPETFSTISFEIMASKADDLSINTNNPLLAVRNPDGSITFFLYINNELVKFIKAS